jgi:predicted phage tail protein
MLTQTNPAWCLLDYLTNTRYGKGLTTSEIDLQSLSMMLH